VRRDRRRDRRRDSAPRCRDAPAAGRASAGRDDHAPAANRECGRSPLPRREDPWSSDAHADRLSRRPHAARRTATHARRPGISLQGGRMSFVEVTGQAKLDRRTKDLVKRLSSNDIAIIDHTDLDRVSAEELVESGVRVVVNVAPSQTGRFPNPGPLALVRAGVRLIDAEGANLFDSVAEGELLTVRGVRRGRGYKRDLRMVRPYLRDFKPVFIAVDGGADALLEAGHKPDVIVGDMDSVSDRALRSGAELLVYAYADGSSPGARRAEELGLGYQLVRATGISEDVALLLAYEKGSELIVAVGTHFNLIEFLERNRAGMSSTFLARLKVGEILIDAKGVSRLASRQVGIWPLVAFMLAGFAAIGVAIGVSPALRHVIEFLALRLRDLLGIG